MSENFSFLALTVKFMFFKDLEEKDDRINKLINDKDVCRTALATRVC